MSARTVGALSRAEAVGLFVAGLCFIGEGARIALAGFAPGWLLLVSGFCAVVVVALTRRGAP